MMRRAIPLALASAATVVLLLAGCGGPSSGISAPVRARLAPLVQQVRNAASSMNPEGAQQALTELRIAVAAYQHQGDIGAADAARILAAADGVQRELALVPTTARPTTTTAAATPTTEPLTKPPGDHGPGNGNDNGDSNRHDHGHGGH